MRSVLPVVCVLLVLVGACSHVPETPADQLPFPGREDYSPCRVPGILKDGTRAPQNCSTFGFFFRFPWFPQYHRGYTPKSVGQEDHATNATPTS